MKRFIFSSILIILFSLNVVAQQANITKNKGYVIVMHGGAGDINPQNTTPEKQAALKAALTEALGEGKKVLSKGGTSLDAVVAAIKVLENSPLFNAGKGAYYIVSLN